MLTGRLPIDCFLFFFCTSQSSDAIICRHCPKESLEVIQNVSCNQPDISNGGIDGLVGATGEENCTTPI
jgi:hypothetical protein